MEQESIIREKHLKHLMQKNELLSKAIFRSSCDPDQSTTEEEDGEDKESLKITTKAVQNFCNSWRYKIYVEVQTEVLTLLII